MVLTCREAVVAAGVIGLFLTPAAAMADVKAGVDAWSRGEYTAAVRTWTELAAQGDPDAQFNMGQAYRLGRGVESDLAQAEALYAKAAAQGHVKAADNYGLLLFQKGEREQAMPYLTSAAGRGDPRAQYIMGIAHFNGDLVEKDWTRAYALLTLSKDTGLPQARSALTQMDEYVPIDDRQQAQTLAAVLKAEAEATRVRNLVAVNRALGDDRSGVSSTGSELETLQEETGAASANPIFSPPVTLTPAHVASGPWKVQLGAFGVDGNAERLWARLAIRQELAGKTRLTEKDGPLTVLFAQGFATRAEARTACDALKANGDDCLVTR